MHLEAWVVSKFQPLSQKPPTLLSLVWLFYNLQDFLQLTPFFCGNLCMYVCMGWFVSMGMYFRGGTHASRSLLPLCHFGTLPSHTLLDLPTTFETLPLEAPPFEGWILTCRSLPGSTDFSAKWSMIKFCNAGAFHSSTNTQSFLSWRNCGSTVWLKISPL